MPSYFVLLSKQYKIDLNSTCHEHIDHKSIFIYFKIFKEKTRPKISEIFTMEVIEVINDFTKYERRIWEEAKILHLEQLKRFDLTVKTATDYWMSICNR